MIKILVADDHPVVRKGLRQIIEDNPDMVVADEASNGYEVVQKVLENDYDLLLVDISMPGKNGLDVLKEVRSLKPKLRTLILSIHPKQQYAVRCLSAGAAGYLTKESAPYELIDAIRKVSSGGKYVSSSLAEKLAIDLQIGYNKELHQNLSDREYQVMCMLGSGKRMSEIAEELHLSVKTISTYRRRILEKMRMKNNTELIRYVIENRLKY